jgi:PAS domain S-box-containing protein
MREVHRVARPKAVDRDRARKNGAGFRLSVATDVAKAPEKKVLLDLASHRQMDEVGSALTGLGVLTVRLDRDGRLRGFNDACRNLTGYALEEVAQQYFWDVLVAPDQAASVQSVFCDGRNGSTPSTFDALLPTKDGPLRAITWRTSLLSGGIQMVFGIDRSVQIQSVLPDQTRDAILVRDVEDNILFWNRGAERLYGWTPGEAVGRNMYELLRQKHLPGSEDVGNALAARGEWTGEIRQVTKTGREITVESRWKLIRDKDGEPNYVLIVNTDVTEKKALESQLLRAQRMLSIEKLAGSVVHDLNNVLSPMLMAVHDFQRKYSDHETQRLLEAWRINAEHAGLLVTQLLTFARGIKGERTSIQLDYIVRQTVEILSYAFPESISVSIMIAPDLWTIIGSPTHLYQVVMNLCVNARDAMPDGGTLKIEAENVVVDEVHSSTHPDAKPGKYVVIKVSDTGTGIPPEIREKIFEPFFTTKHENGTGLGLATVLMIVKNHKGFVEVSSQLDQGTQFRIHLPAEEPV